ncbi:pH-response regulator protein palA/rim20 [Rhodosporidiobolus nylandii]
MSTTNLLPLPYKPTLPIPNLANQVLTYLDEHSQHTHPDELRADCQAWERTRTRLFGREGDGGTPVNGNGTGAELASKLPSSLPLPIAYHPLFSSSPSSSAGIALPGASTALPVQPPENQLLFERASVLYNLAAYWAQEGAGRRRGDEEGVKGSIVCFQHAAGLLSHLLTLLPRLVVPLPGPGANSEPLTPDLTENAVKAMRDMMLAQAQEVAWLKGVMDRLKNGTIAKLASSTSSLYSSSLSFAQSAVRPSSPNSQTQGWGFPDDLLRYLATKKAHFEAVAQYRKSLDDLGANRYGDELSRLSLAASVLSSASGRLALREVPDAVQADLKGLKSVVEENLKRAEKDNSLIYLSSPTPPSSLPPITPAQLVRATVPPGALSPPAPGRAWLAALVPKEVGEVLELWRDRKKEWVRGVERRAGKAEKGLADTLTDLSLPALLDSSLSSASSAPQVPQSLLDRSLTIQADGGVARLESMMQDVRRVAEVNAKMVGEAEQLLREEEEQDTSARLSHGTTRWTRPPSSTASSALRERLEQLSGLLQTAGESDALVRSKFAEWEEALRALEGGEGELRREIPRAEGGGESSREEREAARRLRALLEEVDDLRATRRRVVEGVRTAAQQQGDTEVRERVLREAERFAAERGEEEGQEEEQGLAMFEGVLQAEMERLSEGWEREVEKGEGKQEDLRGELRAAHAHFLSARAVPPEAVRAREQALQRFVLAADKFSEMRQNLAEGLRFYGELSRLVGEVRDGCKSFAYTRQTEAADLSRRLSAAPSSPLPSALPASPAPSASRPRTPAAVPTAEKGTPRSTRSPARTRSFAPPPEDEDEEEGERQQEQQEESEDEVQILPPPVPVAAPAAGTPRTRRSKAAVEQEREREPQPTPVRAARTPSRAGKTPSKKVVQEEEPKREREKKHERVPVMEGGWDPTQGIRFG